MIETLTTGQSAHLLLQDDNATWSYAGAHAIVEYLEQMEEDCGGEPIEFDRVAIRCDFSEYSCLIGWACEYFGSDRASFDELGNSDAAVPTDDMSDDELIDYETAIRDYINEHGQLIEFDGGIIVSSF